MISVETLDDAIAIMSALNQAKKSARADRMMHGYRVRGGEDEEKDTSSGHHNRSHGADTDRCESRAVAGGLGDTDVLWH